MIKVVKNKKFIRSIEHNLERSTCNASIWYLLNSKFKDFDCYLIGGSVRDPIINSLNNKNLIDHDFDIIIDDSKKKINLKDYFTNEKNVFLNSHGSIRWIINKNDEIDITTTSNANPIRNGKKVKPSLKLFLMTCDFNTSSIAYDLRKKIIFDYKAIEGIKKKEIHVIGGNDPSHKVILRLILHSKKLGFCLGKKEISYILKNYDASYDKEVKEYLEKRNKSSSYVIYKKGLKEIFRN